MSLQYYPHEDLHVKPAVRPRAVRGSGARAITRRSRSSTLILAMALVSFAVNGGVIGTLVVLGLIAGFNVLALRGRA